MAGWMTKTLAQRFWAKVYKREGENACWTWVGACASTGYGAIYLDGKPKSTHVVSWFLEHGVWPKALIMHSCDERRCVRPSHLSEGSYKDNWLDAMKKGRMKPIQDYLP